MNIYEYESFNDPFHPTIIVKVYYNSEKSDGDWYTVSVNTADKLLYRFYRSLVVK